MAGVVGEDRVKAARDGRLRHAGDVLSRWVESNNGGNAEVIYVLLHRHEDEQRNWGVLVLLSGHPFVRVGTVRDFSSLWVDMSDTIA